jgi:hypothetical protein
MPSVLEEPADQSPRAPSLSWTVSFAVLRAVALLIALGGFADLLFFGDDYQRASRYFRTHYQVANWSLVFLVCYPRLLFRWSSILAVPLVLASAVSAYAWNWLSRNEVLSVASGEVVLKNAAALLALGFAVEGCAALVRKLEERDHGPVRKW